MKEAMYRNSAVDFAYDVLDMQRKIKLQEEEIYRLSKIEKRYNDLTESSTKHSEALHKNMMDMLIIPGVVGKIAKNNRRKTDDEQQYCKR